MSGKSVSHYNKSNSPMEFNQSKSMTPKYDYDVFLSFRGGSKDVKSFVDKLYTDLVKSGFVSFKDYTEIERGEDLKSILRKTIRESRFSVIVFSKDYLSSKWCLDEFAMVIEECKNSLGRLYFLPVYYDVNEHQVLRELRAFGNKSKVDKQLMLSMLWGFDNKSKPPPAAAAAAAAAAAVNAKKPRVALVEGLITLPGIDLQKGADGDETKFIHEIIEEVKERRMFLEKYFVPIQAETKDYFSSGSKEIPQSDEKDATEICLTNTGLSKLPENSNFTALKKLVLQLNPDLRKIPFSFFERMPLLVVLDLSNTSIKSLPSSISSLVKLRELLMRDCELLMQLPPEIGALGNLNMLDLEGTELICLPKEIGALCNLTCLKVSLCGCADNYKESKGIETIIPRETLSRFSLLEELSIDVDPECVWWDAEVETIIKDLIHLRSLKTLKLYLPTIELLQLFLQLQWYRKRKGHGNQSFSQIYPCLSHFRLIVGRSKKGLISRLPSDLLGKFEKLDRCLKYMNGESNIGEIAKTLKHANALFLDRHWTIENLSVFKIDEMENLCFCLLVQCNEMKNIVDGSELYPGDESVFERPILGSLQYLSIHYMKNLESIWKGPSVVGCLSHLRFLSIHTCPKLSTVFNLGLLGNLINLKELIVEDCREIKSLIVESSSLEFDPDFLLSLEKISLLHLPELVNISGGLCIAPRLERMVVYNCPKLKSLSPVELSSKYIVEIKGENAWWEQLEWHKSGWGSGQPDYLARVFVPFGIDGDLMDQLVEAVKTSLVFEENLHSEMKNKEAVIYSDDSGIHSDGSGVETKSFGPVLPYNLESWPSAPSFSRTTKRYKTHGDVDEIWPQHALREKMADAQNHHQPTVSGLGPRINTGAKVIRVSRSFGSKDRHSKVWTANGIRDRRIRLSVATAIQFYDVQDRLGYDQPSKVVDWLIKKAKSAIDQLAGLLAWKPSTTGSLGNANLDQEVHKQQEEDYQHQQPIHVAGPPSQSLLQIGDFLPASMEFELLSGITADHHHYHQNQQHQSLTFNQSSMSSIGNSSVREFTGLRIPAQIQGEEEEHDSIFYKQFSGSSESPH